MKKNLLLLALLCCFSVLNSQNLFKVNAYLQNPTPNGMTVMWQTNAPCYSWVEYGTDSLNTKVAHTLIDGLIMSNNTENKIRITDLQPSTKYYYRICSKEIKTFQPYKKEFGETEKSRFYSFTTLGDKPGDFTCLIFNDIHNNLPLFDTLCDQVKDINYDFALFNGDCFTDLKSNEDALKILIHYNNVLDAASKPSYYIRGNHEIRGAYALDMPRIFDRDTYFAFTFGDTRFVVLDCGEDKPDTTWVYCGLNDFSTYRIQETEWLKNEINSPEFKKANKHILVHHIPIYGLNPRYYNPCLTLWDPILQANKFDIGINAHTHRFAYHPKGTEGNPFPVIVGGGNNSRSARVMVLEKKGNKLTIKAINAKGETTNYDL